MNILKHEHGASDNSYNYFANQKLRSCVNISVVAMSEYINVSGFKEFLTDCPICTSEYDELEHLPRRMPCCVQAICHPCLGKIWKNNKLRCPICRHKHTLPGGVTSLPIESLMLKVLDHLKIQKGIHLPCSHCPDGNDARYRCDDCALFLCEECHKAHARLPTTRHHRSVTFAEMKDRSVKSFRKNHQCKEHQQPQQFYCRTCELIICVSCTVVNHDKTKDHDVVSVAEVHHDMAESTDDVIINLDQKAVKLEKQVKILEKKNINIQRSRETATEDINRTTDNLIELLQTRRASLLSDVDMKANNELKVVDETLGSTKTLLAKVKSSTEYTRRMRERADQVEDLQLMVSSIDSLNTMLRETTQDVKFDRTGVTFAPVQVTEMKALIDVLGSVRSVTYTPVERPSYVSAGGYSVTMDPAELPQVPSSDHVFSDRGRLFTSPRLEFDTNTASEFIQISSDVINNTRPHPAPQDTGCRFQSWGKALSLRPLPLRRGEVLVFCSRVVFTVKQLLKERTLLWETCLTHSPVDTNWCQASGVSVEVITCPTHKQQLCLWVMYDGKGITDIPLCKYQIGESTELSLCFMIDRDTNKIHVVDVNTVKVVTTIPDVTLDRPMWVVMNVDSPSFSEMKSHLISGREFNVTPEIKQLLISLT